MRAHLVVFCDLESPEVTAWAFGSERVMGVGVYHGVRRPHFTSGLLFGCENYWYVRVFGD